MVLYRVEQPVTIRARITGRYADGWSGPELTYTRYGCRPGRLIVRLARYPGLVRGPQTVRIISNGGPVRAVVLRRGAVKPLSVPLNARAGECSVNLDVSPTASPASALGSTDTRELGVHADLFRYVASRS
jgi:hypothetical protein